MTELQEPYVIIYSHEKLHPELKADFLSGAGELVGTKSITGNESLALGDLQSYPPKKGNTLKLTVSECDELCFDEDDSFLYWLEKIR